MSALLILWVLAMLGVFLAGRRMDFDGADYVCAVVLTSLAVLFVAGIGVTAISEAVEPGYVTETYTLVEVVTEGVPIVEFIIMDEAGVTRHMTCPHESATFIQSDAMSVAVHTPRYPGILSWLLMESAHDVELTFYVN